MESHFAHVDSILGALQAAGVSLKLKKCTFFTDTVTYLGHIIKPGSLEVDASRVAALREAKHPSNQTGLRAFLGLCNVYRRFVPRYSHIAAPLNQLLKKGQPEKLVPFGPAEDRAFRALIEAVTQPLVLALPRVGLPFSIDTDSSDYQVCAALFQTSEDGTRKPIGYWSRSLNAAERNCSVSERECLAVVWAMTTLRPYLQGHHFVVHTDHASLRWLLSVNDPSGRLMRWRLRLSEFDFDVEHKKGKANTQADALSRLTTLGETALDVDDEIPCFLLDMTHDTAASANDLDEGLMYEDVLLLTRPSSDEPLPPQISLDELRREQNVDSFCRQTRARLRRGERLPFADNPSGFLCRYATEREQVVIPATLQARVLRLSHFNVTAGHPGGRRLYYYLSRYFYWVSMSLDCYAVSRNCTTCAKNRILLRKNATQMTLFPAQSPLEFVSIDILGELIATKRGHRFILVITDRFSKLVRTVPLKKITAVAVAQAFVTHWVFVYGPPARLLSDNGKQFSARFFQNVLRILETKNLYTTTYNPQANGQVERFNKTIVAALRHYVGEHPRDWDLFTDALTYAYNTQVHRGTGLSPFELVLSRVPPPLAVEAEPTIEQSGSAAQFHTKWTAWLESLMATAKPNLRKAQEKYKKDFDKRLRRDRQPLQPGGFAFVRKEYHDKEHVKHKLSDIVDGPFEVIACDSKTALLKTGDTQERFSRDRIEPAPPPPEAIRQSIVAPPAEHGAPEVSADDVRTIPIAEAVLRPSPTGPSDDDSPPGLAEDNTQPRRSARLQEPRSAAREVSDTTTSAAPNDTAQFVVGKIVRQRQEADGSLSYLVKWTGFPSEQNTWEPIGNLRRSMIVRYCQRKNLQCPTDIEQAMEG